MIDIFVENFLKDDIILTIPPSYKVNNSFLQALCREFEIGHAYREKGGARVVTLKKTIQYNL
ncbi:hypothetical protein DV965_15145 [Staphylococcus pseudintermedius]|nr:hypothetical protein DV965_15145 [Staphylococcus pseudintermedius]